MAKQATAVKANNAAATPAYRVAAPAHKYAKAPKAVPNASVTYKLTALGQSVAATGGKGSSGKVTCLGLVAVAAANVAKAGRPLTGANIVSAMRTPAMVAALTGATKAVKYAPGGTMPCRAWLAGYVAGAARAVPALLAKVTA